MSDQADEDLAATGCGFLALAIVIIPSGLAFIGIVRVLFKFAFNQ